MSSITLGMYASNTRSVISSIPSLSIRLCCIRLHDGPSYSPFVYIVLAVGDVSFKVKHLQTEVSDCSSKIQTLSMKLMEQDNDICALREELRKLFDELAEMKVAIRDIAEKLTQLDTP